VPPAIQHDALLKGLPLGRDHDTVVLTQRPGPGDAPVQVKRRELQRLKSDDQVLGPVIAEAAFLEAEIDQEVVKQRRADHPVITRELLRGVIGADRGALRFVPAHGRRQRRQTIRESAGRLTPRAGRMRAAGKEEQKQQYAGPADPASSCG